MATVDLLGSDDGTNADLSMYDVHVVDGGLVLHHNVDTGDFDVQIYDWVDGELRGPYGLIGATDNGLAIGGATRDGDRVVVSRYVNVESFRWSVPDQAYVFEAEVVLPSALPGAPRTPALHGDHLVVSFSGSLWWFLWDGAAWQLEHTEEYYELPLYGHRNLWLEPPLLRFGSSFDGVDPEDEPDAQVYRQDPSGSWSQVGSDLYADVNVTSGTRISFNARGQHALKETSYCRVWLYEPDGDGTRFIGPLEALPDGPCDEVTWNGSGRWLATTSRASLGAGSAVRAWGSGSRGR